MKMSSSLTRQENATKNRPGEVRKRYVATLAGLSETGQEGSRDSRGGVMLIEVNGRQYDTSRMSKDGWQKLSESQRQNPRMTLISIPLKQWGMQEVALHECHEGGLIAVVELDILTPEEIHFSAELYFFTYDFEGKIAVEITPHVVTIYPKGSKYLLFSQGVMDLIETKLVLGVFPKHPVVSKLADEIKRLRGIIGDFALVVNQEAKRLEKTKKVSKSPIFASIRRNLTRAAERVRREIDGYGGVGITT